MTSVADIPYSGGKPLAYHLTPFESDVTSAQLRLADSAGFDSANRCFPTTGSPSSATAPLDLDPVSSKDLEARLTAFRKDHGASSAVDPCASCGILCFGKLPRLVPLSKLGLLKLKPLDSAAYLADPLKRTHLTRHVDGKDVYYLHSKWTKGSNAPVCAQCYSAIIKGKSLPSRNVGLLDYGRMGSLSLTAAEVEVVALCTPFLQHIKMVKKHRVEGFTGHVICFPHNGTDVLSTAANSAPEALPNVLALYSTWRITFVGSKLDWDANTKKGEARTRFFLANGFMTVRPQQVMDFLRVKIALDPAYAEVVVLDNLEIRELLRSFPDHLLDNAIVCEDEKAVQMERQTTSGYVRTDEPTTVPMVPHPHATDVKPIPATPSNLPPPSDSHESAASMLPLPSTSTRSTLSNEDVNGKCGPFSH